MKNVIGVSSGKGGVGKSTVAANLAVSLAKLGYKVGLLDADIFGPSVPKMFQVEDARPVAENIGGRDLIVPIEKYGIKLLSIGFFVDPDQATFVAGRYGKQCLEAADWVQNHPAGRMHGAQKGHNEGIKRSFATGQRSPRR